jgi:hypothetical protein
MWNNMYKHPNIKTLFLAFVLMSVVSSFALTIYAKELEVDYPATPGTTPPSSTETSLPDYIKYVFTFIIGIAGMVGLIALLYAGAQYISSAGNPDMHSEAKSRLVSAFWGGILLLSSYALLRIINPGLTTLELNAPERIASVELPQTPITPIPTADLLTRIRQLAQATKQTLDVVKNTANDITTKTNQCNCQNTQAICACEGSGSGLIKQWLAENGFDKEISLNNKTDAILTSNGIILASDSTNLSCKPKTCYAGNNHHPCPDYTKLQDLQKQIIDLRDVALYYSGRTIAERNDLATDIQNFINKKIEWYNQQINKVGQSETGDGLKNTTLQFLNERKGWLEEERKYKTQLALLMQTLSEPLNKLYEPTTKIPALAGQCFSNVASKCQATCKQGKDNGCHDKVSGCQPDKCMGGNPCPTSEIQGEVSKVQSLSQAAQSICDQIISAVNSIQKQKIPISHF